jgi:hypothetical protein
MDNTTNGSRAIRTGNKKANDKVESNNKNKVLYGVHASAPTVAVH